MKTRRIGLLIPSVNTAMEPEFYKMMPAGITAHSARLYLTQVDYEQWMKMFADLERVTRDLATARPDVIMFGCTGASFANGVGWDRKVVGMISKVAGDIPVITTTTAIVDALHHLGVTNVAIATPYPADADQRCRSFLEGSGLRVTRLQGLGIKDAAEIGYLSPQTAFDAGIQTMSSAGNAEALLILCANWRTIEVVAQLELALGKPVITSNQATLWAALRAIGHTTPIKGYGRLLEKLGDEIPQRATAG